MGSSDLDIVEVGRPMPLAANVAKRAAASGRSVIVTTPPGMTTFSLGRSQDDEHRLRTLLAPLADRTTWR